MKDSKKQAFQFSFRVAKVLRVLRCPQVLWNMMFAHAHQMPEVVVAEYDTVAHRCRPLSCITLVNGGVF